MSSGNLIQHSYLKEAIYGELNAAGDFQSISKTSAAFTGTPVVTQSATVRSDRLPSGNIITGLDITGDLSNELASTVIHDEFIAATMMNPWDATPVPVTLDLAYNSATGVMTTTSGDFTAIFAADDPFTLTGLLSPADVYNVTTLFVVTNIIDPLNINVVTATGVSSFDAIAGAAVDIIKGVPTTIGNTQFSYTFEKKYLDLAAKSILYFGKLFNGFTMEFNYGSPVTVGYELLGASKELPVTPVTQPEGARVVAAVPAEIYMNPSTSIPMLMIDGEVATSCIEGITLTLNNGLSAKNCVGQLEKEGYDLGQASIEVTVNAHFSDSNYPFLQRILDQDTVTLAWPVIDPNGNGYYFEVSCQLTGDDPDVTGQDAQALLELSGSGAIGDTGNVLRVFKLVGSEIIPPEPTPVSAIPFLSAQMAYSFDLQQTLIAPQNTALPELNTTRFS